MISYDADLDTIDWAQLVEDLIADDFHNGRTVDELEGSFRSSHAVVFARLDGRVVGTARLLSDGICNAYLVDVWTASPYRRHGVGTAMVRTLLDTVPGQHVALFTKEHERFYRGLGFEPEQVGMSRVAGTWLNR